MKQVPSTNALQIGDSIKDFSLQDATGKTHKFSEYKDKTMVLYFYPKDDTPGCTIEACDFRDNYATLKKKAVVIGISPDNIESHKKFVVKYNLPFVLLADPTHKVSEQFGVWKEKSMYGRKYMGIERTTFIIKNRKIIKIFPKVSVSGHVLEIIKEL